MASKKKSNKKQDNLEEPVVLEPAPYVEPVVPVEKSVPSVEPVVPVEKSVPSVEPVVPVEKSVPSVEPVVPVEKSVPSVEPVVPVEKSVPSVEPVVPVEKSVPYIEPVVLEPAPHLEAVVLEPAPSVEPVVQVKESLPPIVSVEEPKKIDLEINEIFNPLLSNDLENLLIQNVERPKSPPPRRINKRGATMGMKLGF